MKKNRIGWIVSLCLAALLAAAPRIASAASDGRSAPDSRLLQVVLLIGTLDGSSETEHIPPNAVQALKDIENFLPFKSYQLLDTALIRSNAHATGVLSGYDGREYRLSLDFDTEKRDDGDRLLFRPYRLDQDPSGPPHRPRLQGKKRDGAPSAPRAPRSSGSVISTSFTVNVGETIVVGTSKLNGGDKGLLVLLTVIP